MNVVRATLYFYLTTYFYSLFTLFVIKNSIILKDNDKNLNFFVYFEYSR